MIFINEFNNNEKQLFLSSLLFPQMENEKYVLNLKYLNESERFIRCFNSYFELFQYINRTQVRDELDIKDNRWKVWNIGRILTGNELVAQWVLSMDNELQCCKFLLQYYSHIYDVHNSKFFHNEFGQVFLKPDNKRIYYVYLGRSSGEDCNYICVNMNDKINIDMECRIKAEESKRLDKANEDIPEMVSTISDKLIEDPHNYFYLMFYWKSFSRCGDDEQNELMIQLLKNKHNNEKE